MKSFFNCHLLKLTACTFMICLCLCLATSSTVVAGDLRLNGSWQYSKDDDQSSDFSHTYSANYSGSTNLTELIGLAGSMRYTASTSDDTTLSETYSPSLRLNNQNDIYNLALVGNYNVRRSDDLQRDDWMWSSTFSSNWSQRLFRPSLGMFYGQSRSFTDEDDGSKSDRMGTNLTWDYLGWLGVRYGYNRVENKDKDAGNRNESDIHSAQLDMTRSFFDNRLGLSFAQSYLNVNNDTFSPSEDDEFSLAPIVISQAMYEETDDPLVGSLTNDASFLLSDADQPPTTLTIDPANEPMNLGITTDLRQVDVIYLSTLDDIGSFANNFSWDLYSSNNGEDWTLEEIGLLFVYDIQEQRFEFELASQVQRFLKLVADTSNLSPLEVTEVEAIEAFRKFSGEKFTNERTSQQSNFNASYKALDNLRFSYSFNYTDDDDNRNVDTENISHQGSVAWILNQYLSARINAGRSEEKVDNRSDSVNKTYTLSISSQPLPTLTASFGATRSESSPAESPDTTRNGLSFYSTAQLYQDLEASLTLIYSNIEEGTGGDSFSSSLLVTARLRPTLLLTNDLNYVTTIDSDAYSFNDRFSLNWRISDIMYTNSSIKLDKTDSSDMRYQLALTAGITPNRKNRLNATYAFEHDEHEDTHAIGGRWSWIITRVLNFQLNGNYFKEEEDSFWSVTATLNAQYSNN